MSTVILDIGAGSLGFLRRLARLNGRVGFALFGGEPKWWHIPLLHSVTPHERIPSILERVRNGKYRIVARYNAFPFPDQSLDMVTVNAPHPFVELDGIDQEIIRCLKPGGVFFCSTPELRYQFELPGFELCADGRWNYGTQSVHIDHYAIVPGVPRSIPISRTVRNSVKIERMRKMGMEGTRGPFYVYAGAELNPNYRAWVRVR